MNQAKSEAFPHRDADAINRRRSITAGAAALLASTMFSRRNAHARNGRHNSGNNGGNNVGSRCKRQQEQCLAFVEERCTAAVAAGVTAELRTSGDCVSQNRSCREHLAKCHAGAGLDCLFLRAVR